MKKEFIKRELWDRDFIRKFQRDLVEQSVGSFQREYIGSVSEETGTIEAIKKQNLNNTYTAMVRMLTSYMVNYLFEKIIDEILNIINQEEVKTEDLASWLECKNEWQVANSLKTKYIIYERKLVTP
uniref:Uncharacterized protein n=1 Tax=viral metagenome TaxID=1070528 RepID=A0A6H1ZXK3_9ZZZZ